MQRQIILLGCGSKPTFSDFATFTTMSIITFWKLFPQNLRKDRDIKEFEEGIEN